ncbi:MAG: hypothetical protein M9962_01220 [Oligoflexia bacterium]|nr:hypothetical protein [Oligoflexia bacterium]
MSWLVQYRGRILGPISDKQLIASIHKGELLEEHKVSSTKNPLWKNLGECDEFKGLFNQSFIATEILPPKIFLYRKNSAQKKQEQVTEETSQLVEDSIPILQPIPHEETEDNSNIEDSILQPEVPTLEEQTLFTQEQPEDISQGSEKKDALSLMNATTEKESIEELNPTDTDLEEIFTLNQEAAKTKTSNSLFKYLQTQIDKFDEEEKIKDEIIVLDSVKEKTHTQIEELEDDSDLNFDEYIKAIESVRIRKEVEKKDPIIEEPYSPPQRPSFSEKTSTLTIDLNPTSEEEIILKPKRKFSYKKIGLAMGVLLVISITALAVWYWAEKLRGQKDLRLSDPSSPTAEQALFEDDPIPQLKAPTRPERD